jgi:hypothetical protein
MVHDVNYLIATGDKNKMRQADDNAIKTAPYNTQGILMKAGLTLRKFLGLKENEGINNKSINVARGYYLKNKLLNSGKLSIKARNTFLD